MTLKEKIIEFKCSTNATTASQYDVFRATLLAIIIGSLANWGVVVALAMLFAVMELTKR